jgi:hypothetical protein
MRLPDMFAGEFLSADVCADAARFQKLVHVPEFDPPGMGDVLGQ